MRSRAVPTTSMAICRGNGGCVLMVPARRPGVVSPDSPSPSRRPTSLGCPDEDAGELRPLGRQRAHPARPRAALAQAAAAAGPAEAMRKARSRAVGRAAALEPGMKGGERTEEDGEGE